MKEVFESMLMKILNTSAPLLNAVQILQYNVDEELDTYFFFEDVLNQLRDNNPPITVKKMQKLELEEIQKKLNLTIINLEIDDWNINVRFNCKKKEFSKLKKTLKKVFKDTGIKFELETNVELQIEGEIV